MPKDVARARSWLGTLRGKIVTAGLVTRGSHTGAGPSPQ
jgi:hypothetical protein